MNTTITLQQYAVEIAIIARYVVMIPAPTAGHAEGVAYGLTPTQIRTQGQPIRSPRTEITTVESVIDADGTRHDL